MILRLDHVELGLVRVVIVADIAVCDVDLRFDFLVDQFGFRESDFRESEFQVIQGHVVLLELVVEPFLGVIAP